MSSGVGVEFLSSATLDPVLYPSNDPGFHLEDDFVLMTALEQRGGDVEVLLEGEVAPVDMWLLKRFGLPALRRLSVSSINGRT